MCHIHHLVLVAVLVIEPWVLPIGVDAAEIECSPACAGAPLPRYTHLGLGFLHPLPSTEPDVSRLCRGLPQQEKDHVYVFLINGCDPLYLANLNGLCAYLQALGFAHAEVGQMTASTAFRNKILHLRACDGHARIALLGFSAGAYCAQAVVQTLKKENVSIELLIYLGGDMIQDGDRSRPENVHRIVNITGHGTSLFGYGLFFNGTALCGARNVRLPARHFALPSQPQTIEILVEELVALTCQAPAIVDSSPGRAARP